ncbi:hypothetical protein [Sphingomonas edaphi]|jgi:hypothetical protein|uniref:Uncharacterized protein n=1 Tax=Sphingomonas edaphi TaxID=2315689 RepID=A0A418PZS1_9SPHN|nr:hypothetical protein [Sphingomonas edaphi]RIX29112.1 hypothetical protein D3M59_07260 [Sphingomonas edaphi]
MSRALFIAMNAADVTQKCDAANVGISAIETLPNAGVRLVCMSAHGAEVMRQKLKSKLIDSDSERYRIRPRTPLW